MYTRLSILLYLVPRISYLSLDFYRIYRIIYILYSCKVHRTSYYIYICTKGNMCAIVHSTRYLLYMYDVQGRQQGMYTVHRARIQGTVRCLVTTISAGSRQQHRRASTRLRRHVVEKHALVVDRFLMRLGELSKQRAGIFEGLDKCSVATEKLTCTSLRHGAQAHPNLRMLYNDLLPSRVALHSRARCYVKATVWKSCFQGRDVNDLVVAQVQYPQLCEMA